MEVLEKTEKRHPETINYKGPSLTNMKPWNLLYSHQTWTSHTLNTINSLSFAF